MADGSAIMILEDYEHAVARGAHIYAEVVGYGSTCDAYHATAPRPDGSTQAECIRIALEQAGFDPSSDNVYINAHGTGTMLNDVTETKAYKLAFGDFAYKCHISSTKSMHGHMFRSRRRRRSGGHRARASGGRDPAHHQPRRPRPRM